MLVFTGKRCGGAFYSGGGGERRVQGFCVEATWRTAGFGGSLAAGRLFSWGGVRVECEIDSPGKVIYSTLASSILRVHTMSTARWTFFLSLFFFFTCVIVCACFFLF